MRFVSSEGKGFILGSPAPTTPNSAKGLWTLNSVSDSKDAAIDVSQSPLFVRKAQESASNSVESSPKPSAFTSSLSEPFKFKVTVGPTRRELSADLTPRKEIEAVIVPRLPLNFSQDSSRQSSSESLSRKDSNSSNSSTSSSSSRKRENTEYAESPAKRRRISFGTKSVRKPILPIMMSTLTSGSSRRDVPTAASIFEPPEPQFLPTSSHNSTPVRARAGSVVDKSNPSTPSKLRLNAPSLPSTPATATAQVLDSLSLGVHLNVPETRDSDAPLSMEEIAAWVIFGQEAKEATVSFLLAYPHFKITSRELFKLVWGFYHQPPLQYWKIASTFSNQRAKVVEFVSTWMTVSYADFEWSAASPAAPSTPRTETGSAPPTPAKTGRVPLKFINKFVESLKADNTDTAAIEALMESQPKLALSPRKMAQSAASSSATTSSSAYSINNLASPRGRSASASRRSSKYHARRQSSVKAGNPITFEQIEPGELAMQMTLLDFARLRSVPLTELIGQAWNKSDKAHAAPRLTNIINNFNNISYWVAQEISQAEGGAKEQAKRIDRFINVGNKLKSMGNFNGVMQIFSGLISSSVQKLTEAWKLIPSKQMARYKKFETIMSPYHNYGTYRTRLNECKSSPAIPYIGIHLGDIVHLLEGTEDEVPDKYALHKVLKLGDMLRMWFLWQRQNCEIAEDSDITQFLALLRGSVSRDV